MALDSAWWSACAALSLDVSLSPGFSLQLYTATYDVYISNPQNANSPAFLFFFFFFLECHHPPNYQAGKLGEFS